MVRKISILLFIALVCLAVGGFCLDEDKSTALSNSVLLEERVKDYVCGMEIDKSNAKATEKHKGLTFYFCSENCHKNFKKEPDTFFKGISKDYDRYAGLIFKHYLSIYKVLIKDKVEDVEKHSSEIVSNADILAKLEPSLKTVKLNDMQKLADSIAKSAKPLSEKKPLKIKEVKEQFSTLSNAVIDYYKGIDKKEKNARELYVFYCPMEKKSWLQDSKEMENPYGGGKCGKLVEDYKSKEDEPNHKHDEHKDRDEEHKHHH